MSQRAEFLAAIEKQSVPLMVVIAEQAPPASLAEMEAMAKLANTQSVRSQGSLGMAEELRDAIASLFYRRRPH